MDHVHDFMKILDYEIVLHVCEEFKVLLLILLLFGVCSLNFVQRDAVLSDVYKGHIHFDRTVLDRKRRWKLRDQESLSLDTISGHPNNSGSA